MNAYIYNADLYCQECAEKIMADLVPAEDSNEYPQGPYPDGGGESDCPNHCASCGEFLDNPLTAEGYAYVEAVIQDQLDKNPTVSQWASAYGFSVSSDEC